MGELPSCAAERRAAGRAHTPTTDPAEPGNKKYEKMKITIRGTTDSLDPNDTCNNPKQSLANYNAELDAAILAEYPNAEIIHENIDDCSGIVVVGQTDEERAAEDEIRDFVQRTGEDIYAAGNFWEPPFQLAPTVSSTGPVYRGQRREWRVEVAADLNSYQVINENSDCDTFERNGEDFVETHSSGVTENWSEADFKTVINEINRLSSEEKRTEELKRLVIEKAGLNPEWAKDHFEIIS